MKNFLIHTLKFWIWLAIAGVLLFSFLLEILEDLLEEKHFATIREKSSNQENANMVK